MKGMSGIFVMALLIALVFSAGCFLLGTSDDSDGSGTPLILGLFNTKLVSLNPADTVCESPTFRIVNLVLKGESDSADDTGKNRDHCYQAVAVNLGDTSLCQQIKRPAPRSKCYLLIAEKYEDSRICSLMPASLESMDSYSQIECLDSVATKTGDSRICDEIGTRKISRMFIGEISKTTCYQHVANGRSGGGTG